MSSGMDEGPAGGQAAPSVSPNPAVDLPAAAPSPAAAMPAPPPVPMTVPAAGMEGHDSLSAWLQAQRPRLYWRVLAGGVVALFLVWYLFLDTLQWGFLTPIYDLAFGLLVPATVALYWWERGAPEIAPLPVLRIALACGAVLGLIDGLVLSNMNPTTIGGSLAAALVEEVLKLAAVAYLLLDTGLRREWDGLIVGVVAALAFSALETAAYGFITFQQTLGAYSVPGFSMFRPALANMDSALAYQLLLQLFASWVWTGILCAAIWRDRGPATFAPTRGVGIAAGIVLVLHMLWNYSFFHNWLKIYLPLRGYLPIATLLVGAASLVVFWFFLDEARQSAPLGPDAAPAPLEQALPAYGRELWRRLTRAS